MKKDPKCRYCTSYVTKGTPTVCVGCGRGLMRCFNGKMIETGERVLSAAKPDNEWARKHRPQEKTDERRDSIS